MGSVMYTDKLNNGYHGRHGTGVAAGIRVEASYRDSRKRIVLMPINTRSIHRSCYIDIPRDAVNALIRELIAVSLHVEGGDAT